MINIITLKGLAIFYALRDGIFSEVWERGNVSRN